MCNAQKIDHYHRIIPIVDTADECLFVVPTSVLRQANMEIGDEFIVIAKQNGLVIKKIRKEIK